PTDRRSATSPLRPPSPCGAAERPASTPHRGHNLDQGFVHHPEDSIDPTAPPIPRSCPGAMRTGRSPRRRIRRPRPRRPDRASDYSIYDVTDKQHSQNRQQIWGVDSIRTLASSPIMLFPGLREFADRLLHGYGSRSVGSPQSDSYHSTE